MKKRRLLIFFILSLCIHLLLLLISFEKIKLTEIDERDLTEVEIIEKDPTQKSDIKPTDVIDTSTVIEGDDSLVVDSEKTDSDRKPDSSEDKPKRQEPKDAVEPSSPKTRRPDEEVDAKPESGEPDETAATSKVSPPAPPAAPPTQVENKPKPKPKPLPKELLPERVPQIIDPAQEKSPHVSPNPIVPKSYDKAPDPLSISEILKETLGESDDTGPYKGIDRIIRENLPEHKYEEGEDGVSFSGMSFKYQTYFRQFADALYNEWRYPPNAARKGEYGTVRVAFSITKDGTVTDINVIESSGSAELDREVLRTLKSMRKTPLPSSSELNVLHVNGFFIYSIYGAYRLY